VFAIDILTLKNVVKYL